MKLEPEIIEQAVNTVIETARNTTLDYVLRDFGPITPERRKYYEESQYHKKISEEEQRKLAESYIRNLFEKSQLEAVQGRRPRILYFAGSPPSQEELREELPKENYKDDRNGVSFSHKLYKESKSHLLRIDLQKISEAIPGYRKEDHQNTFYLVRAFRMAIHNGINKVTELLAEKGNFFDVQPDDSLAPDFTKDKEKETKAMFDAIDKMSKTHDIAIIAIALFPNEARELVNKQNLPINEDAAVNKAAAFLKALPKLVEKSRYFVLLDSEKNLVLKKHDGMISRIDLPKYTELLKDTENSPELGKANRKR